MNATQAKRKEEVEKALSDYKENALIKIKEGKNYILAEGMAANVMEDLLNWYREQGYKFVSLFTQQFQMQTSQFQVTKGKPVMVTFHYPVLERVLYEENNEIVKCPKCGALTLIYKLE